MDHNSESVQHEKSYTYMVRCSDGTLYTGWTNDLKKRIRVHNSGKGAKYTRCRLPVQLVYYEEFSTKREAMSREVHIKQLNKVEKEALAASFSVDECFIC
ncbi:MAG: GIY-YIG nuclease family protein [Lachnospiraceae bacterium]|nr:GIY-YIG nuclease family protein [Lachnospiraceae bacterium]